MTHQVLLAMAFAISAAVYAAAGFGGGTAYLALLALAAMPARLAAVLALICNVVVVTRTTYLALRLREFDWLGFGAFAVLSVPAAWLGASYRISDRHLELLLGGTLLLSALALLSPRRAVEEGTICPRSPARKVLSGVAIGGPLGFVSGMVGIGGGVFLSPILHYLHWNTSRRIATLCSAFILVNSLSGLLGKRAMFGALFATPYWWVLPVAVWIGGTLGSKMLLIQLSNRWITRVTAVVVFLASLQTLARAWR